MVLLSASCAGATLYAVGGGAYDVIPDGLLIWEAPDLKELEIDGGCRLSEVTAFGSYESGPGPSPAPAKTWRRGAVAPNPPLAATLRFERTFVAIPALPPMYESTT